MYQESHMCRKVHKQLIPSSMWNSCTESPLCLGIHSPCRVPDICWQTTTPQRQGRWSSGTDQERSSLWDPIETRSKVEAWKCKKLIWQPTWAKAICAKVVRSIRPCSSSILDGWKPTVRPTGKSYVCDGAFGFGLTSSFGRPCTPNTDFSNIIKVHTKKVK